MAVRPSWELGHQQSAAALAGSSPSFVRVEGQNFLGGGEGIFQAAGSVVLTWASMALRTVNLNLGSERVYERVM